MAAIWTEVCGDILPKPSKLELPRRKKLLPRLKDTFGRDIEQWRAYCQRIRSAPALIGQTKSGWRASIDWALEPKNAAKVLEGNYDAGRNNGSAGSGTVRPTEVLREMFDGNG